MANKKKQSKRTAASVVLFLICVVVLFAYDFAAKDSVVQSAPQKSCNSCHNRHDAMSRYFEKKGNPTPQRMATAVLETTRPRLMASIAVRESHGNPKAVGDGGKSRGAFQVQGRHHGRVSNDPIEQALQSERILDELIAENNGNLKKALSAYNGERTRKVYAKNVLAELVNVP